MDGAGIAVVFVISLVVLAGAGLMIAAMGGRRRERELAHRERVAMIERGLIPSPETDPMRFEAAMQNFAPRSTGGVRFRTAGVMLIGVGLAAMMLITFTAGQPEIGLGVGGAWAILGAASLLNYFLISRREEERDFAAPARWVPPPPRPPVPPANGAP